MCNLKPKLGVGEESIIQQRLPYAVIDTEWHRIRRTPCERRTAQEQDVLRQFSRYKAEGVRNGSEISNLDEEVARIWLEMKGYDCLQPAGDPPDYVASDRYAVEVRRLNRMVDVNGRTEGEEEFLIPLRDICNEVLASLGPRHSAEHSWYIDINCDSEAGEPPKEWKKTKKKRIKATLREVLCAFNGTQGVTIPVGCGISLVCWRAHETLSQRFVLNQVDDPGSGWILADLIPGIKICIEEKTRKIKDKLNELSELEEWWLILVDHISRGMIASSERYLRAVRDQIPSKGPWSRCIVVDYWKPDMYFEL